MTTIEIIFVSLVYLFAFIGVVAFIKRLMYGKHINIKVINIIPDFSEINTEEKKSPKRTIYRSSITGKLVSERFALNNPTTTEKEEIN